MINSLKRAALTVALAATGFAFATVAEARDGYRDRGDNVAIAVGAGIVGLAVGAALADRDDHNYYDRGYYPRRHYVRVRGYPDYYYYYDNAPRRYYRDRYYGRDYRGYDRRGYDGRGYARRGDNRWERGQRRVDRWYGRDYHSRDYRYRRGY